MNCIEGKSILITGGTGSFGRRFTQVLLEEYSPERIVIYSRDEFKQGRMHRSDRLQFVIGDVRDELALRRAMSGIDVVVHAAAMKQIPCCEANPLEAIKTNVLGSANVISTAIDSGVRQALTISTDKAVHPVNLYGATKMCMEKLFTQANDHSDTMFNCVRYGNVSMTRGSVLPFFLSKKGTGCLPITDPRMTRFWLELDDAIRLVLHCLQNSWGQEIFVPKLESFKVADLATAVDPTAAQEIVGIRPGEKIHETLVSLEEARHTLETENIFIILPKAQVIPYRVRLDPLDVTSQMPVDGYTFTSDNNSKWLDVEQLRAKIYADHQEGT